MYDKCTTDARQAYDRCTTYMTDVRQVYDRCTTDVVGIFEKSEYILKIISFMFNNDNKV
jgi:hypothetical protein